MDKQESEDVFVHTKNGHVMGITDRVCIILGFFLVMALLILFYKNQAEERRIREAKEECDEFDPEKRLKIIEAQLSLKVSRYLHLYM